MSDIIRYTTRGTCSREIVIEIDEGRIADVLFVGGCAGNTQGVASLVRGMEAEEVVRRLENIDCNGKGTSCPDQLARALRRYLAERDK